MTSWAAVISTLTGTEMGAVAVIAMENSLPTYGGTFSFNSQTLIARRMLSEEVMLGNEERFVS